MGMPVSLSAVIITYNEERNIRRCLESLMGVADEIVVVDSYSTDQTEHICREFGVRFVPHSFEGHIQQKNFAINQATNDWILSLDADEALTETLRYSILEIKENPTFKGYRMNRLTNYCGKWVKHCGWYPDTKTRLIHKDFGRWEGVNPHDRLEINENLPMGLLKGDLLHYSYYTKEDHFKQIAYFGDIAARELHARGKRAGWLTIGLKVIAQFFKSFFLKMGLLDGKTGVLISFRSAYATFVKYNNLRKLRHRNGSK
jgi:glycosyltransferase involved in cell wall biosynthesis